MRYAAVVPPLERHLPLFVDFIPSGVMGQHKRSGNFTAFKYLRELFYLYFLSQNLPKSSGQG